MDTETEQRFISLERQISILRGVAADQMLHNQESNRHLTMLLGIVTEQQRDLSTMQADISSLKSDVTVMQSDLAAIKERLATVEGALHTGFAAMNERFDAIMALLSGNQPKPPEQ
jgi:chromosome segregation ATPase